MLLELIAIGSELFFGAAFFFVALVGGKRFFFMNDFFNKEKRRLTFYFDSMLCPPPKWLNYYTHMVMGLSALLWVSAAFLFPSHLILLLLVTVFSLLVPRFFVWQRWARYKKNCRDLFPDLLTLLANSLRCGLGLQQAFGLVASDGPPPFRGQFGQLINRINLGMSLEESMEKMARQIEIEDMTVLTDALSALKKTGGNLVETFEVMADLCREKRRVMGRVLLYTAQGRCQAMIIMMMPPLLLIMMQLIAPDFVSPLFTTPIGWLVLLISALLLIIGGFIIYRIVKIEV